MKYTWLVLGIALFCTVGHAEQDLPITLVEGDTIYRSQLNYVEALSKKLNKTIWKTVLYPDIEPKTYDSNLEKDVQWNVIKELKLEEVFIRAIDSQNRAYLLNKTTGKIERQ